MSRPSRPIQPSAGAGGLEIRVLGPLEVRVDGRPLVVDTRKALAILALLAVERRPFARDELAALLWPESDDESARGALRRTLSVLRTALGDRWLRADRAAVSLDLGGAWFDLEALEAAGETADREALRAAATIARGPFLAGFSLRDSPEFDDWRATRASAVERSVADYLDRLAAAEEAGGGQAEALAAASRRVELDPLDEPAQRRLMGLLARMGDRAGAIRQYRACVAVLERELGVAPLAETTELYEAIRDARIETAPARAAPIPVGPSRLPLAGRERDLATILETHARSAPDGRLVLVTGEAGIGKTRLAEAVADAVAADAGRVFAARAFATETAIAYGQIVELLRAGFASPDAVAALRGLPASTLRELERLGALPDVIAGHPAEPAGARTADGPAAHVRLLEAITTTLAAMAGGRVPGLLVVEDLQWADEASREALLYLGRRLAGRPVLVLLGWRPEDLDDLGQAFASAAEALPDALVLPIGRLDRAAVERLAEAAAASGGPVADADSLLAASEGLPLYVVEALAAGAPGGDGAARTIRALLRERLAAVSETAGQVLAAAAVIGRSFDLALVRAASGRSEEETITALEELVRRGLVRELPAARGAAFDFAHARLREAAYEATSLARRRLLHRRTAELLRAEPVHRDDPGLLVQLATHERAAGRDAEAAEAFRAAGLRARALYANREATVHLETALALGHPDLAGIQLALGEVRTAQGDYAGAIAALEAAAAVIDQASLPAVELRLGRVHARRGDLVAAASHLDGVVEALQRDPGAADASLLARALVERAVVAHRAREPEEAAEAASLALAIAEAAGDEAGAGSAHRILGLVARDRGDLAAAREALARSLAFADADPDMTAAIAARNALALVEAAAGDHEAAISLLEGALEACRRTGERHLEAAVENNLADRLHAVGREEEAMDHLKRAVTLFAEVGGRPGELEPEIWKLVAW